MGFGDTRIGAAFRRAIREPSPAWGVTPYREQRDALGAMETAWKVGKPTYPARNAATYDRDAYRKLALIFRCVTVMANAIASAPIRVYEQREQQPQEKPNHAMRRLMQRPNPMMGEARFLSIVAMTMGTAGFSVVEKVRNRYGSVVQLWPLRSDWIYPIPRSQSSPDWEYRIPGFDRAANPDVEVTDNGWPLIRAANAIVTTFADTPDSGYTGIGPLEVALREWGLLNTMQDFLKSFFDNGAMPTYGLVLADGITLSQEKADLVRAHWAGRYSGWKNRDRADVPILQTIKDIKRLSFDYNELAYVDLRDISEIAICTAFGVPGSMVGQRFAQERNTFTNYGEARQSFYEDTVVPLWARLDDALTFGLLPEFETNRDIYLEFDKSNVPALQEDIVARRDHALRAMQAGGISRADYKRLMNLPVESGDDVYLMPFNVNLTPVGQKITPAPVRSLLTVHEPRALPTGDVERRARGLVAYEQRSAIQRRANALYTQAGANFGPRFAAFFRAQGRRYLEIVQRSDHQPYATRDVAQPTDEFWDNEDAELKQQIEDLWNLMGGEATADVNALLGFDASGGPDWNTGNPWVKDVLDKVGPRVTGINATTREDLARIVGESLDAGATMDEMKARISAQFEETYVGRAETIARTESQVAFNEASAAGFRETGIDEVELLDNPMHTDGYDAEDGLTCAQRNGKIVPVASVSLHIRSEHPNGQLAIAPVLDPSISL